MQLPVLFLADKNSVETDALGEEVIKSHSSVEGAVFGGQKYVLFFSSHKEANRYLELHRLVDQQRTVSLESPHEAASFLGKLASDGVIGIIVDFTNRKGGRRILDLDPVLRQMRQLVDEDVRREQG